MSTTNLPNPFSFKDELADFRQQFVIDVPHLIYLMAILWEDYPKQL